MVADDGAGFDLENVPRVPEMIVSYADAAALMLANLTPSSGMSRHRVGWRHAGKKEQWAAKPKNGPELS